MENSNRDVRTELSELIGRLLSNIHEARKPEASLASSDLASATEEIADAILDEFHVKRRLLGNRSLKAEPASNEPKSFTYAYDPLGRQRSATVLDYFKDGAPPTET